MTQPIPSTTEADAEALRIFNLQTRACLEQPEIALKQRLGLLKTIEGILIKNDQAICEAICADFGNRSFHETRILEITPSILGLRHTCRKLKKWMTSQRRQGSMIFPGGRNRVIPQAKGVAGIITPWNYPLFLALSPMTSALAAGNRIMVKQAANSRHLCRLLHDRFSRKTASIRSFKRRKPWPESFIRILPPLTTPPSSITRQLTGSWTRSRMPEKKMPV